MHIFTVISFETQRHTCTTLQMTVPWKAVVQRSLEAFALSDAGCWRRQAGFEEDTKCTEKKKKKNPISTTLITICVQLLNALQAELHALCIVMRSVTEGSSSRETCGESFKVKGMRHVWPLCMRQETTDAGKHLHTHTHTHTHPTKQHSGCLY